LVIFCNKESAENEIMLVYSGYEMNLPIMEEANPQFAGKFNAYIFEDDYDIIRNPGEYRVYLQKNKPAKRIVCKKPVVTLCFEGDKDTILSDGIDYTVLKGVISDLQTDEEISEIKVSFNDNSDSFAVNDGCFEFTISSTTAGTIKISLNNKLYLFTPLTLNVL